MKRKAAVLKVTLLGVVLGLVAVGGLAIYYYTLPPTHVGTNGSTTSLAANSDTLSSADGRQYLAVQYNGTNYTVPAKGANSPSFGCPTGTSPSLCALLENTCGNGVGPASEPWKTCYNCVFDAGCTGDNSCDPYTHLCSAPASACMVAEGYNGPAP
jgi:hypothetical protein